MRHLGVVGAGTMGSGIAEVAVRRGFPTVLYDVEERIVAAARERIRVSLDRHVQRRRLTTDEAEAALVRLTLATRLDDLAGCDLIIEAAPEDLALKRDLFAALDRIASPEAVLASNTSSLSITALGAATRRPQRVVGMHFFNPAPAMALVEVVPGRLTPAHTVETVAAFAGALGKTPIRSADTPGFIVNRIARPFYLEALRLLSEGATSVEEIDRIMRLAGGFRMGPFELLDLIGLDVNLAVTRSIYEAFFHEPRYRPHPLQEQMVRAGQLGRKTGAGFYTYDADGRPTSGPPGAGDKPQGSLRSLQVTILGAGPLSADFTTAARAAGWTVDTVGWPSALVMDVRDAPEKLTTEGQAYVEGVQPVVQAADVIVDFAVSSVDKLRAFHPASGFTRPDAIWLTLAVAGSVTDIESSALALLRTLREGPAAGGERVVGFASLPRWSTRRLVEVIPGWRTSPEALARARALFQALGKETAVVRNAVAGVFPRIFAMIVNEAAFALAEGVASAADIDTALRLGANYPQPPLALADEMGLDVLLAIVNALHDETGEERYRAAPFLRKMVAAGWTGRAAGRGFFEYGGT